MSKLRVIDKKSEQSINSEREFLSFLHHPFIVNMHYAFQDNENLYLVMDLLSGGDLRYHISRYKRFSEEQTRFFLACMILSLNYIHSNKVIHRDIKPENLVLEENGYVRITDFGIAKENTSDNSSETSGTPGYMSPEVLRGLHHSYPVDYFAVGVIGYEFMMGKRPYHGSSRKEIKEKILAKQAMIKENEIREGWSPESVDFINRLLLRKPEQRLGSISGAKELMNHPWLKYYPWKELEEKTLLSPYIPEIKDNYDKKYCEKIDKITEETKYRYEEILANDKIKTAFVKFYYDKEEAKERKEKKDKEEIRLQRLQIKQQQQQLLLLQQQTFHRKINTATFMTNHETKNTKTANTSLILGQNSNNKNNSSNGNNNNETSSMSNVQKIPLTQRIIPISQNTSRYISNNALTSRPTSNCKITNERFHHNRGISEMSLLLKRQIAAASNNNSVKSTINNLSMNQNKENFLHKLNNNNNYLKIKPTSYKCVPYNRNQKVNLLKAHMRAASACDKNDSYVHIPPIIPANNSQLREKSLMDPRNRHNRSNNNDLSNIKKIATKKAINRSSSDFMENQEKYLSIAASTIKVQHM